MLLGLLADGAAVFAAQVETLPSRMEGLEGVEAVDVRSEGQKMTGPDAALLALANGLFQWHAAAAFSMRSGARLAPTE